MADFSFIAAFIVGILGAGHCIAMCGGVMATFALAIPNYKAFSFTQKLPYLLAYNVGRLTSYTIAGAIVASSSQLLKNQFGLQPEYFQLLSSILLILLGLYIANISSVLTLLEKQGQHIWKYISPITGKFMPLKHPALAFPFGFLWGWLPCGLVYSMLTWSLATADWLTGSLIMLTFGLGTLPTLLLVGTAAVTVKNWLQNIMVKRIAGLSIAFYGQWLLVLALTKIIG